MNLVSDLGQSVGFFVAKEKKKFVFFYHFLLIKFLPFSKSHGANCTLIR